MDEENRIVGLGTSGPEVAKKTRRDFAKTAAQVAVTAPAVALLLGGAGRPALAQTPYPCCEPPPFVLDDFTFGNDMEDIDAVRVGSNTNPLTGAPEQDDHV